MSVLTAVVVVHAAHDGNNNNTLIEYGVTIDGNRPHRCCHVPSKVENIDSTPTGYSSYIVIDREVPVVNCPFRGPI